MKVRKDSLGNSVWTVYMNAKAAVAAVKTRVNLPVISSMGVAPTLHDMMMIRLKMRMIL